jgi:cupin fold WbuC family metalloprotein
MIKLIDNALFENMLTKAKNSSRKRSHHNFHEELNDQVQRLCVALTSGTYLRPHKHDSPKWEMMIILEGCIDLLLFDKLGCIEKKIEISSSGRTKGIEIPPEQFHTVVLKSKTAVFIEVKPGPFLPTPSENFASWSPEEGNIKSKDFLAWAEKADVGEKYKSL